MDNTNKKTSHGFLKLMLVLCILFAIFYGICKYVEFKSTDNSSTNSDGSTKLLSRSAKNSDIEVESDLDLSNFGVKYVISPQIDISNLEITLKFLDENKKVLYTLEKTIGNVKESVQISFSISLFDLSFSVAWNTRYESWSVTGGTVSYFA